MPAHSASAGRAMLAQLGGDAARQLYLREAKVTQGTVATAWLDELEHDLQAVRRVGFAVNREQTELGITALGAAIRDGAGDVVAGLSVSVPQARFREVFDAGLVAAVFAARDRIEAELEDFDVR